MQLPLQPYKGARDFYPEDKRRQNYIFAIWRRIAERYGYENVDAPLLELTDLYRAKSGDEIVNQQAYRFEDRGGRDVTIRPEMTPSIARMVAARRQEIALPARWYSIPNLWRYERPQHGRLREHWQLNVDLFGIETVDAELELILVANDIMKAFGGTSKMYTININSRQMNSLLMAEYLELDPIQSHLMMKLLDKRRKMEKDAFMGEATQIFKSSGDENQASRLEQLLEAKSMADLPQTIQNSSATKQIQILFTHLKEYGLSNVKFDVGLLRGLDYYTDIVFEIFDNHPDNNRSMFGGGRYDSLIGMFGVEQLPTVGFGMGDVALLDFLSSHDLLPELGSETDIYIITIGDVLRQAQGIARILREEGVNVAIDISFRKVEKQIKVATKKSIPYAMFVGEEELNDERFNLKNLATQEEEKMSLERIIARVKDYRARDSVLQSEGEDSV